MIMRPCVLTDNKKLNADIIGVPTQTWLWAVTTHVCKPEAANTVGAPDDERRTARNMLSF